MQSRSLGSPIRFTPNQYCNDRIIIKKSNNMRDFLQTQRLPSAELTGIFRNERTGRDIGKGTGRCEGWVWETGRQDRPIITSVALIRATAESPDLRPSSRTASEVMIAVTC